MVQSDFRFEFPSDRKLPSTLSYISAWERIHHGTVMYYLYAKLSLFVDHVNCQNTKEQKNDNEVIKEFHYPIVYQEDETTANACDLTPWSDNCYSASFMWKDMSIIKPKSAKTIIDSLIRRKPKVMPELKLQVTSAIPQNIDISKGFEQIPLCFEVSHVENIKDFIIDNQSTTLGRFTVTSFYFYFKNGVIVGGTENDYLFSFATNKYNFDSHLTNDTAIIDVADGKYDSEKCTLTYNTTLDKLFPSKAAVPSSFVNAFRGVPLPSCNITLPHSKLDVYNSIKFDFVMKHTQWDLESRKSERKRRFRWDYYSSRLHFGKIVDFAYNVDDSTLEGDLVTGLLVESCRTTEIDLNRDLDESKVITVNTSLPKRIGSTFTSHSTSIALNECCAYKIHNFRNWMNKYLLMTNMIDKNQLGCHDSTDHHDSGNYHDCYHSGYETTVTDIPVSSEGGYSSGGCGYSGGDSGGHSGGGHDSGGGGGCCEF
ncbi:unnamed protein product [Ambrosiozyma monospora]|uniref:Unnamed protein product n=1 Tax=Ambrosiozyma monospora TaxID=43982 RepID=A0ACB5TAS1_AMBMO|nr:unnamed protein product [Ambrosiozyma monospora]